MCRKLNYLNKFSLLKTNEEINIRSRAANWLIVHAAVVIKIL